MAAEPRYFDVYRDLECDGRLELVQRPAEDLTDEEILALPEADRAYVLGVIGCIIDDGEVVQDPTRDVASERRAA